MITNMHELRGEEEDGEEDEEEGERQVLVTTETWDSLLFKNLNE